VPGPEEEPAARLPIPHRLLARRDAWRAIKGEALLLQGVRADWKDAESPARLAKEFVLRPFRAQKALRLEYTRLLTEELRDGVVREVPLTEVKWLNPTFLVPKAGGKWRKILDCRRLNEEMKDRHFKMESAEDVLQIARAGDWATSLDFRAAFNHLTVDSALRPYLCFQFAGRYYQYLAMPFGLKQAPRVFTRLMKRAVAAVRERWKTRMVFYMDDSLLLFQREEQARKETKEIAAFFSSLGWSLAEDKCQFEPVQTIHFLGWQWNCAGAHVAVIPKRRLALISEIKAALAACEARNKVPTLKLAGLIGRLSFLRLQTSEASLHLMALDSIKVGAVRRAGWSSYAPMHPGASGDLKWWLHTVTRNVPRPWEPPPVRSTLTTDASPNGWGAELKVGMSSSFTFGHWKEQQRRMSSNAKELTAVRMALAAFSHVFRDLNPSTVIVESDNTTAVHVINNKRAAISLATILRSLLTCAGRLRVNLRAVYLPGIRNDTADRLSRMGELTGFYLKSAVLESLLRDAHFTPTLDVFAREPDLWRQTAAAERPEAEALWQGHGPLLRWEGEHLYLHPPLNKIGTVLRRLQRERTPALLVTPNWTSQPWSPILAQMVEEQIHLGPYDNVMETTPSFRHAGWRLPPGEVVASILATRMTRVSACSTSSSQREGAPQAR
jgi:ribonuclease HI